MAQPATEFRYAPLELREDSEGTMLVGYAATFNQPYIVGGQFREVIHPDAFNRTLANGDDVLLLKQHQGDPFARTKSGTLKLSTDSHGLRVQANLDPASPRAQDLMSQLRRGDLDAMSFGFRVPNGGDVWDFSKREMPDRVVREAILHRSDVSVVAHPANDGTEVELRGAGVSERDSAFAVAFAMLTELRDGREIEQNALRGVLTLLGALDLDLSADLRAAAGMPEEPAPEEPTGTPYELARRIADAL